jgi:hypothetical protein
MSTETVSVENLAVKAWVEQRRVFVELCDERIISFPSSRFRKLKEAPDELLEKVQIEVDGYALRWEEIDEDITVPGIVAGSFELPPA